MTNAELFKAIFGLYATEIWSKPEEEFLEWLKSEWQDKDNVIDLMRLLFRKKGKWLYKSTGLMMWYHVCSECGEVPQGNHLPEFCPNCGSYNGTAVHYETD